MTKENLPHPNDLHTCSTGQVLDEKHMQVLLAYFKAWRENKTDTLGSLLTEDAEITTQIDEEVSVYRGVKHNLESEQQKLTPEPVVLVQNKEKFLNCLSDLDKTGVPADMSHFTIAKAQMAKKDTVAKVHLRTVSADMLTKKTVKMDKRKAWDMKIEFDNSNKDKPLIKRIYQKQYRYAA